MNDKCEKCGGELIDRKINSMQGIFFYPVGEETKFKPKRSAIICRCCVECGHIQELHVEKPEQLR